MPQRHEDDITETAAGWIARRANHDLWTLGDEAGLRDWLERDPRHRQEFEILQAIHTAAGPKTDRSEDSRRRQIFRPMALAAAIGVTLFGGWAVWHFIGFQRYQATYATRIGETSSVDLPDGSHVEIDTNTELRVDFSRKIRVVQLRHGQAMFSVDSNPDRPFVVRTIAGEVRVVGTRFQVRRDARDGRVRVAVQEGKVRVLPAARDAAPTALQGGQAVSFVFEGAAGPVEKADDETFAGWRGGWIVFHDHPLEEVVAEMNRYCHERLRVETAELKQTRISGSFSIRDLSEFFAALQRMLPVTAQHAPEDEIVIGPRRQW